MTGSPIPTLAEFQALEAMAASLVAQPGAVPRAMAGNQSMVLAMMLAGREWDIAPIEALRNLYITGGKTQASAGLIHARILRAGGRVEVIEHDEQICTLRVWKDGEASDHPYTIEQARAAGLVKADSAWMKHPADMLFARSIGQAGRRRWPEILANVYAFGEIDEQWADYQGGAAGNGSPAGGVAFVGSGDGARSQGESPLTGPALPALNGAATGAVAASVEAAPSPAPSAAIPTMTVAAPSGLDVLIDRRLALIRRLAGSGMLAEHVWRELLKSTCGAAKLAEVPPAKLGDLLAALVRELWAPWGGSVVAGVTDADLTAAGFDLAMLPGPPGGADAVPKATGGGQAGSVNPAPLSPPLQVASMFELPAKAG